MVLWIDCKLEEYINNENDFIGLRRSIIHIGFSKHSPSKNNIIRIVDLWIKFKIRFIDKITVLPFLHRNIKCYVKILSTNDEFTVCNNCKLKIEFVLIRDNYTECPHCHTIHTITK